VVLQNCVDLQKVGPGSYSETCHARVQVIYIKTEDFTDTEEEKETFPDIKSEHEVSFVSVCTVIHISKISSIAFEESLQVYLRKLIVISCTFMENHFHLVLSQSYITKTPVLGKLKNVSDKCYNHRNHSYFVHVF
jgi:hypothetical protein